MKRATFERKAEVTLDGDVLHGSGRVSPASALSSLETTVLLTVDETLAALRKAEQVRYRAPGA